MNKISTLALLITLVTATQGHALETYPSRLRLLVHTKKNISAQFSMYGHLIPAGNLLGELSPLIYLGAGWKPNEHFELELDLGWHVGMNESLLSIKPSASLDSFWFWGEVDIQYPSWSGYWFAQAEYQALSWLHFGFEGEGWGSWKNGTTWSHGGGPNILLRPNNFTGIDLALHTRKNPDQEIGLELFIRFHLFL